MRHSALRWPAGSSGGKLSRSWTQSHGFVHKVFCRNLSKARARAPVAHLYFVYARPFFYPEVTVTKVSPPRPRCCSHSLQLAQRLLSFGRYVLRGVCAPILPCCVYNE